RQGIAEGAAKAGCRGVDRHATPYGGPARVIAQESARRAPFTSPGSAGRPLARLALALGLGLRLGLLALASRAIAGLRATRRLLGGEGLSGRQGRLFGRGLGGRAARLEGGLLGGRTGGRPGVRALAGGGLTVVAAGRIGVPGGAGGA